jgi:hypothetical protein
MFGNHRRRGPVVPFVVALSLGVVALSACSSTERVSVDVRLVAPEKERADLERALAVGAITRKEYEGLVRGLPPL